MIFRATGGQNLLLTAGLQCYLTFCFLIAKLGALDDPSTAAFKTGKQNKRQHSQKKKCWLKNQSSFNVKVVSELERGEIQARKSLVEEKGQSKAIKIIKY